MVSEGNDRLDSWKAIAFYLKRDVRTVQLWEKEQALPVHRHRHASLPSVFAYKSELDSWCSNRTDGPGESVSIRQRLAWALAIGAFVLLLVARLTWSRISKPGAAMEQARIDSVAVLPLTNLAPKDGEDYFADGMTEELITDLARIGSLRVISRSSVMKYKGTARSLPEIAHELQVNALVEGTVRQSGDRVRITVQLVRISPERHIWADAYEGDLHDVLSLQRDVARDIASEIQTKLDLRSR